MIGLLAVYGYIALNVAGIAAVRAHDCGGLRAWWRS